MEEYDCHGKLSSLTLEKAIISPEGEEQRFLTAKLFFDNNGREIQRRTPKGVLSFQYNEQGQLEKETESRKQEETVREKIYEYSTGRLLQVSSGRERTSYHYNSRGKLDYTSVWQGDVQESISTYVFDDQERLIRQDIHDSEGQPLRSSRFERNTQGLITGETVINQENTILKKCRYTYPVFHGENWLKRECWEEEDGKEASLREILYRNISMAPEHAVPEKEEPMEETEAEEQIPEDNVQDSGPIRFRNGTYRGERNEEGLPDGLGEFTGPSRYIGEFHNGHMHGRGNLLHKNGSSYSGEFQNGLPHGEGECLWPDGSRYRGQFVKGEMHGLGSFTWADGSRFTGLFEHNRSTDQGLLETGPGDTDKDIEE